MTRPGRETGLPGLRPAEPADWPALEALLKTLKLPTAGVSDWIEYFWLAEEDGRIVGMAGLELYPDGALLRSVAVDPRRRSAGLGQRLVGQALDTARRAGASEVFLLTTTAQGYFPRLGFEEITRASVPPGVQTSIEFREACPASAIVMRKALS